MPRFGKEPGCGPFVRFPRGIFQLDWVPLEERTRPARFSGEARLVPSRGPRRSRFSVEAGVTAIDSQKVGFNRPS
jgi:hypothetical protein